MLRDLCWLGCLLNFLDIFFFVCFQEDDEYIGFASLPEQVHRKAVRRGFEFTLMVVGGYNIKNRSSYMSAHVLLNLLIKLRKKDKM